MTVEIVDGELRYTNDAGDWRITLVPFDNPVEYIVGPILNGTLNLTDGSILNRLSDLITEARQDALSRGIDWDNIGAQ